MSTSLSHETQSARLAFREAMSRLGAAVNVITTDGPAGRHGLTVSAVCSVTDSPPTVLVCINQSASAHDVIRDNGVLCVNVLGSQHEAVSTAFGQRGLNLAERYASASWTRLGGGAALADAAVSLDCRIQRVETVGTHSVFFCEVTDLVISDQPAAPHALIYFNRRYHALCNTLPESTARPA
jgi:flavin reductase